MAVTSKANSGLHSNCMLSRRASAWRGGSDMLLLADWGATDDSWTRHRPIHIGVPHWWTLLGVAAALDATIWEPLCWPDLRVATMDSNKSSPSTSVVHCDTKTLWRACWSISWLYGEPGTQPPHVTSHISTIRPTQYLWKAPFHGFTFSLLVWSGICKKNNNNNEYK